jgi:putative hemolysin
MLLALLVAGSVVGAAPPPPPAPPSKLGTVTLANPASVACGKAGGKLDIVTDETGGQVGICTMPDGRQCEEWALYRSGQCILPPGLEGLPPGPPPPAPAKLANPATAACTKAGGTHRDAKDGRGNAIGICVRADGSRCEEWTLFLKGQCFLPASLTPN